MLWISFGGLPKLVQFLGESMISTAKRGPKIMKKQILQMCKKLHKSLPKNLTRRKTVDISVEKKIRSNKREGRKLLRLFQIFNDSFQEGFISFLQTCI